MTSLTQICLQKKSKNHWNNVY